MGCGCWAFGHREVYGQLGKIGGRLLLGQAADRVQADDTGDRLLQVVSPKNVRSTRAICSEGAFVSLRRLGCLDKMPRHVALH